MFSIGKHVSSAKGYLRMGKDALSIGANTLQFFARNPRGSKSKPLNIPDLTAFSSFLQEHQFAPIVGHAPYTLNACSKDPGLRKLASQMFAEDLTLMSYIPGNYYNFHPGSHLGQGFDVGADYIVQMLNAAMTPDQPTTVLLETMAGKGTEIGRTFEELAIILDKTDPSLAPKLGVCLDSCHIWDAGYDLLESLDKILEELDSVVGLDRVKAFHLNDSQNPLGSRKDRHASIGEGHLGLDGICAILNHPKLKHLPFILETPQDLEGHGREIQLLKEHVGP